MTSKQTTQLVVASALGIALVLAFYVYAAGLPGFFQLDDFTLPTYAPDSEAWHEVTDSVLDGRFGGISRSFTKLTYALTLGTSGFRPEVFKIQNIFLHLANGLLVFWLVLLLANSAHKPDLTTSFLALGVAAAWLLHPIQVSTVLYPVQRYVLLSAFFSLGALIAYTKARITSSNSILRQLLLYFIAFVICWPLALLSKETAALLPLYILAIEFFLLRFATTSPGSRRLFWAVFLVFVACPLAIAPGYFLYAHETLLAGYAGRDFNLYERLLTELQVLGLYLKLILVPIPSAMSLYHDNFPITREVQWPTFFAGGFWLFLIILALHLRTKSPLFGLGVALFLSAHVLEATVIPLELVFEHRNYLALLGIGIAVAGLLVSARYTAATRVATSAAIIALITLLALNTFARAHAWSDRELLVKLEYQENPSSHRLLEQMAMLEFRRGNKPAGRKYLREIATRYPSLAAPYLVTIRTYCNSDSAPSELLVQAERKLGDGPLTAFDANSLLTLTNKVLNNKCAPIKVGDLRPLTNAAAENSRVHVAPVRVSALLNAARVSAASGMSTESLGWALKAVGSAANLGIVRFKKAVEEGASIQSVLGQPGDLDVFLQGVTQQQQKYLTENELVLRIAVAPVKSEAIGTSP